MDKLSTNTANTSGSRKTLRTVESPIGISSWAKARSTVDEGVHFISDEDVPPRALNILNSYHVRELSDDKNHLEAKIREDSTQHQEPRVLDNPLIALQWSKKTPGSVGSELGNVHGVYDSEDWNDRDFRTASVQFNGVEKNTEQNPSQAIDCSAIWDKVKQLLCREEEEDLKSEARQLLIGSVESFVAREEVEGLPEAPAECERLPFSVGDAVGETPYENKDNAVVSETYYDDKDNATVDETHYDDRDSKHYHDENSYTLILQSYIENEVIDSESVNIFGDEFLKTLDGLSEDMIQYLGKFILEGLLHARMYLPESISDFTLKQSRLANDYKENLKKKITVFFQSLGKNIKRNLNLIKGYNGFLFVELYSLYFDIPGADVVVPFSEDTDSKFYQNFCEYLVLNFVRYIGNLLNVDRSPLSVEAVSVIKKLEDLYKPIQILSDQVISMNALEILEKDLESPSSDICSISFKSIFSFCTDPKNSRIIMDLGSPLVQTINIMNAVLEKRHVQLWETDCNNFVFSEENILKCYYVYGSENKIDFYLRYIIFHMNRIADSAIYLESSSAVKTSVYLSAQDVVLKNIFNRATVSTSSSDQKSGYLKKLSTPISFMKESQSMHYSGEQEALSSSKKQEPLSLLGVVSSKRQGPDDSEEILSRGGILEFLADIEGDPTQEDDPHVEKRSLKNTSENEERLNQEKELKEEMIKSKNSAQNIMLSKLLTYISKLVKASENELKLLKNSKNEVETFKRKYDLSNFRNLLSQVLSSHTISVLIEMWISGSDSEFSDAFVQVVRGGYGLEIEESKIDLVLLGVWAKELMKELQDIVSSQGEQNNVYVIAFYALEQIKNLQEDQEFFLLALDDPGLQEKKECRKRKKPSLYLQSHVVLNFLIKKLEVEMENISDFKRKKIFQYASKMITLYPSVNGMNACIRMASFLSRLSIDYMSGQNDSVVWNAGISICGGFLSTVVTAYNQSSGSEDHLGDFKKIILQVPVNTFIFIMQIISNFTNDMKELQKKGLMTLMSELLYDVFLFDMNALSNILEKLSHESELYQKLHPILTQAKYFLTMLDLENCSGIVHKYFFGDNTLKSAVDENGSAYPIQFERPDILVGNLMQMIKTNKDSLDGLFLSFVLLSNILFSFPNLKYIFTFPVFSLYTVEEYDKKSGILFVMAGYFVAKKINISPWLRIRMMYDYRRKEIPCVELMNPIKQLIEEMRNDSNFWKYHYLVLAGFSELPRQRKNAIKMGLYFFSEATRYIISKDFKNKSFLERLDITKKFLLQRRTYIKKILLGRIGFFQLMKLLLLPIWLLLKSMQVLLAFRFLYDVVVTIIIFIMQKNIYYDENLNNILLSGYTSI